MKRTIALILSVMLAAGMITLFAACNNNGEDYDPTTSSPPITDVGVTSGDDDELDGIRDGWVPIATLDEFNNAQVLGLIDLFDRNDNVAVTIDNHSALFIVFDDDEEIRYVTVDDEDKQFPVNVQPFQGERTLFARGIIAGSPEDTTTIDLREAGDLGTALSPGGANGSPNAPDGTRQRPTPPPPRTTTRATAATTRAALGTAAPPRTTTTATTTANIMEDARNQILNSDMTEAERQRAFRMLSYRMDENGVFYTERDPWQKQFGFNALFDMASPFLQLVYGTIRVYFRYGYVFSLYPDGPNRGRVRYDAQNNPILERDENGNPIPKDWLIQFWHGRYGLVLLGSEIGVYTKPANQAAMHFFSAVEEEYLVMQISTWQHNFSTGRSQYLFTRGPHATWWITGFVPGSFHSTSANNRGKDETITVGFLGFPSNEMARLVYDALIRPSTAESGGVNRAGMLSGPTNNASPSRARLAGNRVHFSWQFLDQDVANRRPGSAEFYRLRG